MTLPKLTLKVMLDRQAPDWMKLLLLLVVGIGYPLANGSLNFVGALALAALACVAWPIVTLVGKRIASHTTDHQRERLRLALLVACAAVSLTIGAMSGEKTIGGWIFFCLLAGTSVAWLIVFVVRGVY